jgi:hypothetical protein
MKLEAGKSYVLANGETTGPLVEDRDSRGEEDPQPFYSKKLGFWLTEDGQKPEKADPFIDYAILAVVAEEEQS